MQGFTGPRGRGFRGNELMADASALSVEVFHRAGAPRIEHLPLLRIGEVTERLNSCAERAAGHCPVRCHTGNVSLKTPAGVLRVPQRDSYLLNERSKPPGGVEFSQVTAEQSFHFFAREQFIHVTELSVTAATCPVTTPCGASLTPTLTAPGRFLFCRDCGDVLWIYAATALAAVAGYVFAPALARRATRRPVMYSPDDEFTMLAAVWARPYRLPYLLGVRPHDFADPHRAQVWQAMVTASALDVDADITDEQAHRQGVDLAQREPAWRSAVLREVSDEGTMVLAQLSATDGKDYTDSSFDDECVQASSAVMSAGMDRSSLNGASVISWSPQQQRPVRLPAPVTVRRSVLSALLAAVWTLGLLALLASGAYAASVLAAAALTASWLVLGVGMLVIAFVDYDTLYLDMPVWAVTTVAAWVLAVVAAVAAGDPSRLLAGVVTAAITAAVFEILNVLYKLVRGRSGQGFGDTLIVLASVGVPAALTGSWVMGYVSVMAALVIAIVWFALSRVGKHDTTTPFAFGPFLALGPIASVVFLGVVESGLLST